MYGKIDRRAGGRMAEAYIALNFDCNQGNVAQRNEEVDCFTHFIK